MHRTMTLTVLAFMAVLVSMASSPPESNAGCITLSGGGKYCASWITGSNIDNQSVAGVGKICDSSGTNCSSQVLAAVGGTNSSGGNPNCNETSSNFPTDADNCGVEGIAFCINRGGNASKAQGNPFTLPGNVTGVANIQSCLKNGKCTASVTLSASADQVVCQNPNWELVTWTATKYKGKSAYCTTSWDITVDPPVCVNGGTVTTLVELCTIDPSAVKPTGGQPITCVPLP